MRNLINKLYKALFGDNPHEEVSFNNKLIVAILFISFIMAFIIITTQFIASNVTIN